MSTDPLTARPGTPPGGRDDAPDGLEGQPHRGEVHGQIAETLRRRYPRFDDVLAVRRAVDPAGTFANDCTDRVLGPVERDG